MPQALGGHSRIANGNINVASFVKEDTSRGYAVVQAGAGDKPVGIAHEAAYFLPGLAEVGGGTTPSPLLAAKAGLPLMVYGPDDECFLQAGSAGWTAGDKLKPDASGNGVTAGAGDNYGAYALDTVNGSEWGRVVVQLGKL